MLSTQHEILEVLGLVDVQSVLCTISQGDTGLAKPVDIALQQAQAMVKGRYSRIGPTDNSVVTLFINICGDLNMLYIFRNGIWHSYKRIIYF
jgi:hypothetical protein